MWLSAVTLSLIASVLAHAVTTRLAPARNVVASFLLGGVVVGLALLAWAWGSYGPASIELWSAALVYAAFCELYLFMFTLALSSISANVLVRLANGPRAPAELDKLYENEAMVEQRLVRMLRSGLYTVEGAALRLTPRGQTIVRGYRFFRALFRHL